MTTFLSAFAAGVGAATVVLFAWPWIGPWLRRHDQPQRLLDALREEWDKESDEVPPRYDDRPW